MGQITILSTSFFVDGVKKGCTPAKLRAICELIDAQITQKETEATQRTTEILRPVSVVGESVTSILNVANPYAANTLCSITIYKQIYVVDVETEVGYEQVTPTKITKSVAFVNDIYKIEGLPNGKYHIVFSPAAVFIPYTI